MTQILPVDMADSEVTQMFHFNNSWSKHDSSEINNSIVELLQHLVCMPEWLDI